MESEEIVIIALPSAHFPISEDVRRTEVPMRVLSRKFLPSAKRGPHSASRTSLAETSDGVKPAKLGISLSHPRIPGCMALPA